MSKRQKVAEAKIGGDVRAWQKLREAEQDPAIAEREQKFIERQVDEQFLGTVDDLFKAAVDRPNRRAKPPRTRFANPDALKDFQQQGLGWLLEREGYVRAGLEISPSRYAWMPNETGDAWINAETGVTVKSQPVSGYTGRFHQQVGNVNSVYGGILADEMGLGKTVQMISLIATHEAAPLHHVGSKSTLVVVPMILLGTWESELKKWAPKLSVYTHWGPDRAKSRNSPGLRRDVVLTTYDTLKQEKDTALLNQINWWRIILDEGHRIKNPESEVTKAVQSLKARNRWIMSGTPIQNNWRELYPLLKFLRVRPYGEMQGWYRLIEQQLPKLYRAGGPYKKQATENLRNLIRVLVMRRTKKTPAGQSIETGGDPLLKTGLVIQLPPTVMPRISPEMRKIKFWKVTNTGLQSYEIENAEVRDDEETKKLKLPYVDENGQKTFMFVKELVHIPEKRIEEVKLNFYPWEKRFYDQLVEEGIGMIEQWATGPGDVQPKQNPLVFLLRLRQAAIHPWLTLPRDKLIEKMKNVKNKKSSWPPSSKLEFISGDLSKTLPGGRRSREKSLVFSQFTRALDLMELELQLKGWVPYRWYQQNPRKYENQPRYVRIDGSSSKDEREWAMRKLKEEPGVKLALLSLHAAGVGLNLISANNVYFMDLFFNPQIHAQAIDRTHRIGQDKEVVVKTVTVRGTVEDALIERQEFKDKIFEFTLQPFVFAKDKIIDLFHPHQQQRAQEIFEEEEGIFLEDIS